MVLGHDLSIHPGSNFSPIAALLLPQGFSASIAVSDFSAVLQDFYWRARQDSNLRPAD
jgi:hypothetical protein